MKIDVSVELLDMPDRDVAAQRLIVIAREIRSGLYSARYNLGRDGPPDQMVFVTDAESEEHDD